MVKAFEQIAVWLQIREWYPDEGFEICYRGHQRAEVVTVYMATTAFNVLNTLLVGIYQAPSDVAYWSVCLSMVSAIQSFYSPITDGVYPSDHYPVVSTVEYN